MNLQNMKLLFVEDESDIQEIMKDILSDEVANLYMAKDGQEAYKMYKEKKPDIILSDINIPKINGIDFIKQIRQNDHTTRAIMLTAYSDVETLLSATELKLTKYLVKPFTAEALFDALNLAVKELANFNIIPKKQLDLKDNYTWDFEQEILSHYGIEIKLTPKEKKILNLLFSNLNIVLPYDTILMEIWDDFDTSHLVTLKTMMKNIRKKLPENTIKNIHTIGYKVDNK